jgi:hypothetical protein
VSSRAHTAPSPFQTYRGKEYGHRRRRSCRNRGCDAAVAQVQHRPARLFQTGTSFAPATTRRAGTRRLCRGSLVRLRIETRSHTNTNNSHHGCQACLRLVNDVASRSRLPGVFARGSRHTFKIVCDAGMLNNTRVNMRCAMRARALNLRRLEEMTMLVHELSRYVHCALAQRSHMQRRNMDKQTRTHAHTHTQTLPHSVCLRSRWSCVRAYHCALV